MILYQIDAFTNKLFSGNPAAVIPLKKWLPDELMQRLALENNLSETVFFIPSKKKGVDYDIRWFTPELEINLCGHATLASAYVIFEILKEKKKKVVFDSKSGKLMVLKDSQKLTSVGFMGLMDFPSWKPEKIIDYPNELLIALGYPEIVGVYKNRDYLVELHNEDAVRNAQPDFTLLKKIGEKVIISAPGKLPRGSKKKKISKPVDFVSRFFAPSAGVDEDPVTGSAHSQLIPFWSEKLKKRKMQAKQLSNRGGDIYCELKGDRVIIGGECVFYMKGEIDLP
ncbi:MAG: PhzF family phenazine biosynthesis protein [Bacteroidia bacterium]|nr:PhzF family phenazine biosynthesis protein [Bacteroidia bacterium]